MNENIIEEYTKVMCPYDYLDDHDEFATNDADDYRLSLRSRARELYDYNICLCIFRDAIPELIPFCKARILRFARYALEIDSEDIEKLDRAEEIKKQMMAPQMGAEFEDYYVEHFEEVIVSELRRAKRALEREPDVSDAVKSLIIKEMNVAKEQRSRLSHLRRINRERIKTFYDKYMETARHRDINMLQKAIDEL